MTLLLPGIAFRCLLTLCWVSHHVVICCYLDLVLVHSENAKVLTVVVCFTKFSIIFRSFPRSLCIISRNILNSLNSCDCYMFLLSTLRCSYSGMACFLLAQVITLFLLFVQMYYYYNYIHLQNLMFNFYVFIFMCRVCTGVVLKFTQNQAFSMTI